MCGDLNQKLHQEVFPPQSFPTRTPRKYMQHTFAKQNCTLYHWRDLNINVRCIFFKVTHIGQCAEDEWEHSQFKTRKLITMGNKLLTDFNIKIDCMHTKMWFSSNSIIKLFVTWTWINTCLPTYGTWDTASVYIKS